MKCDVLLLADVFEKLRSSSLKDYGLCPSHCLGAPSLSCDAVLLNMTKSEPELVSDADMYFFFEKGMRGDISYISKIYSKASNNYFKSYDPKNESKHIIYLEEYDLYVLLCLSFFQQVDLND